MIEILMLAVACLAGIAIGIFFFGGLWWTLREVLGSKAPALWLLGSLMVRVTGALAGFYLVSGQRWERLLACLLGFVMGRLVVTRFSRVASRPISVGQERGHAPYSR